MDFQRITVYPFSIKKKGTFTMMKKLISLLLSLMLCLSLLPTQALAASDSDENNPPPPLQRLPPLMSRMIRSQSCAGHPETPAAAATSLLTKM